MIKCNSKYKKNLCRYVIFWILIFFNLKKNFFYFFLFLPVIHILFTPTLSVLISDDFSELITIAIWLVYLVSPLHLRSMFASCSLNSRQDCGFSVANSSFSQTGSAHWSMLARPWNDLDEAFTIHGDIASPSEGLFTMRHSFRLNAHAISRSFEPIVVIEI